MIYQILQKKVEVFDLPPDPRQLAPYHGLLAKIEDFQIMFNMLVKRNVNWSLLVTTTGEILGQNYFVNLNITDARLHRAGIQPPPNKMILLPISENDFGCEESYVDLCEHVLENRHKKTGKLSKSARHEFYRKFIRDFDDLLLKERRGRTGQSRFKPGRELPITKDDIHENLRCIFPDLLSYASIEKDLTDFKHKVEAARSPKNVSAVLKAAVVEATLKYRRPAKSIPYSLLVSEQSRLRSRLTEIDSALEDMRRNYKNISPRIRIHWNSLYRRDERAIREALTFYVDHIRDFYLQHHFETFLKNLLQVYSKGLWSKQYPIFASTGRKSVRDLRVEMIELAALTLDTALEYETNIEPDILSELDLCSRAFIHDQDYDMSEAGIQLQGSIRGLGFIRR